MLSIGFTDEKENVSVCTYACWRTCTYKPMDISPTPTHRPDVYQSETQVR